MVRWRRDWEERRAALLARREGSIVVPGKWSGGSRDWRSSGDNLIDVWGEVEVWSGLRRRIIGGFEVDRLDLAEFSIYLPVLPYPTLSYPTYLPTYYRYFITHTKPHIFGLGILLQTWMIRFCLSVRNEKTRLSITQECIKLPPVPIFKPTKWIHEKARASAGGNAEQSDSVLLPNTEGGRCWPCMHLHVS